MVNAAQRETMKLSQNALCIVLYPCWNDISADGNVKFQRITRNKCFAFGSNRNSGMEKSRFQITWNSSSWFVVVMNQIPLLDVSYWNEKRCGFSENRECHQSTFWLQTVQWFVFTRWNFSAKTSQNFGQRMEIQRFGQWGPTSVGQRGPSPKHLPASSNYHFLLSDCAICNRTSASCTGVHGRTSGFVPGLNMCCPWL